MGLDGQILFTARVTASQVRLHEIRVGPLEQTDSLKLLLLGLIHNNPPSRHDDSQMRNEIQTWTVRNLENRSFQETETFLETDIGDQLSKSSGIQNFVELKDSTTNTLAIFLL